MGRASVRNLMWPAFAFVARLRSCSSIPNVSSAFAQRTASHSTPAARNNQPLLDLDYAQPPETVITDGSFHLPQSHIHMQGLMHVVMAERFHDLLWVENGVHA